VNLAASGGGSGLSTILLFVVLIGLMYLLIIRPQQRRRKQMESMQAGVGVGSEVVTIGGLHAKVVEIDDQTALLEAAPGVNLRYARGAISRVIEPTAAESADTADTADAVIERDDK
jgi:preprotein translocase subunit YajC